jgi:hypothetical protein
VTVRALIRPAFDGLFDVTPGNFRWPLYQIRSKRIVVLLRIQKHKD